MPLPDGLPKPVERFYRKIYGDKPWATFRLENTRLNVGVSDYLRAKGI